MMPRIWYNGPAIGSGVPGTIKAYEYSHFGGSEVLAVGHPASDGEINAAIAGVSPSFTERRGSRRYSPKDINRRFAQEFHARGYRELREPYTIQLEDYPTKVRGPLKQIDFVKGRVLVQVQLGNYFAMFYDMAKFQYLFNENRADVGVEIVPCIHLKKQMSSGVAYGEQLVFDIERLKRHFPAVPVRVILVNTEAVGETGAVEVVEAEGPG